MQKKFKARPGSTFGDEKAQQYGEFLWELKEENGELLRPAFVVEKAKPKNSPIHDFFEWDDRIAGQKHREWQARYLLGSIEVIEVVNNEDHAVKAFHNITVAAKEDDGGKERGYVTLQDIKENQDYLDIVLENAKNEMIAWEKRYSQYEKLRKFRPIKPVFDAIKRINA